MTKGVWWIKRDIRLHDNQALHSALSEASEILPVYIFEPPGVDQSHFHLEACYSALSDLRDSLLALGAQVAFFQGEAVTVFSEIKKHYNYQLVFSHQETGLGYTFKRDKRVARYFKTENIKWTQHQYCSVIRGLKDKSQRSKAWRDYIDNPVLPAPKQIPLGDDARVFASKTLPLKALKNDDVQLVTERAAVKTLDSFLRKRSRSYSKGISKPGLSRTSCSRLAPHLAWGTISLRAVYQQTEAKLANVDSFQKKALEAFISRLHWRDHFIQRFEREVQMESEALNPAYNKLEFDASDHYIECYFAGKTGEPLVDACMRALNKTGYLNFRMRAMLVSYACHALRISWKLLVPELAKRFLDYEPGIHVSQIQMQAGVSGISTLRIYNPYKQLIEHDPNLSFVKEWVPELDPKTVENLTYEPLVDSREAVKKMKDSLYKIKNSLEGRKGAAYVYEKHGSTRRMVKRKQKKPVQQGLDL